MIEKRTEQELCALAVEWLQHQDYEVYQEVEGPCGGRADLVGKQGNILLVCEAKRAPSLTVLGQAFRWIGSANFVWIATWSTRASIRSKPDWEARRAFERFVRDHGIGWVEFDSEPHIRLDAKLHRRTIDVLTSSLNEGQKTAVTAGGNRGGHWTRYKESCCELLAYVQAHQNCTLKEAIEALGKLHYSSRASAKATLAMRIRDGHVPGVAARSDGTTIMLHAEANRHGYPSWKIAQTQPNWRRGGPVRRIGSGW